MAGRPLKNYDTYMDKLKQYAKACEIELEFRNYPGDGAYVPSRRKVILDKDLPESTEVATLLHELGHSLDDTLYSKPMEKKIDKAYTAVYKRKPTASQLDLVVETERRAWTYGRSIAKKLRIPLGKWFDTEEHDALKGYSDTESHNR